MIYYGIDLETTGLDPETCQILSIGLVQENTNTADIVPVNELPYIHIGIAHDKLRGDLQAFGMNAKIISTLSEYVIGVRTGKIDTMGYAEYDVIVQDVQDCIPVLLEFIRRTAPPADLSKMILPDGRIRITGAGKNLGTFDIKFLESIPGFTDSFVISHRTIDPSFMYTVFDLDNGVPGLSECKKRLLQSYPNAFDSDVVTHTAIDDARDIIQLVRHATDLYGKELENAKYTS